MLRVSISCGNFTIQIIYDILFFSQHSASPIINALRHFHTAQNINITLIQRRTYRLHVTHPNFFPLY